MAGLLGYHMEDAGEEGTRLTDAVPGGLDESETATAAVDEVVQESVEVADADAEADDMGERVELAEDLHDAVEPVVTEGAGLDRAGMALLLSGMRRVAGRHGKHLVGRDVKMEAISAGVSGRREQTRIQFESIKDTLKQAWEAIKAAFKKAWAKVKTWYVKTFDASKKLKSRAEKMRTRAENSTATIDKNKFSFAGAKTLATGGKLQAAAFVTSLGTVKTLSNDLLDKVESDKVDDAADDLTKLIGDEVDATKLSKSIKAITDKYKGAVTGVAGSKPSSVTDKIVAGFGEDVTATYTAELPGGKVIVRLTGKAGSEGAKDHVAALRRTRLLFTAVTDKPKDISGESETLSASQVSKVADLVIDIADNIFDFKKGWESRDSSQAKVLSALDKAFATLSTDKDIAPETQRLARSAAGAATDIIRRDSTFRAVFVSYAMNLGNVALSYCERSMAQYKK